jgi:regulator of RNase E activity RraA
MKVFCKALSCLGAATFTRPSQVQIPVIVQGVTIAPGDLVMGDADGVVVVPQSKAKDVIALCRKSQSVDDKCMQDLKQGRSLFETFQAHRGK